MELQQLVEIKFALLEEIQSDLGMDANSANPATAAPTYHNHGIFALVYSFKRKYNTTNAAPRNAPPKWNFRPQWMKSICSRGMNMRCEPEQLQ